MATFTFSVDITNGVAGDRRAISGTVTSSGAFTAGGDTINPSVFGLSRIDYILMAGGRATSLRTMTFVAANPAAGTSAKFRAITSSSGAEYTGSGAQTFNVTVIGY